MVILEHSHAPPPLFFREQAEVRRLGKREAALPPCQPQVSREMHAEGREDRPAPCSAVDANSVDTPNVTGKHLHNDIDDIDIPPRPKPLEWCFSRATCFHDERDARLCAATDILATNKDGATRQISDTDVTGISSMEYSKPLVTGQEPGVQKLDHISRDSVDVATAAEYDALELLRAASMPRMQTVSGQTPKHETDGNNASWKRSGAVGALPVGGDMQGWMKMNERGLDGQNLTSLRYPIFIAISTRRLALIFFSQ